MFTILPSYVAPMCSYVTNLMLLEWIRMLLLCTRVLLVWIRMLLLCTRALLVFHSNVPIRMYTYPYVTRMYSCGVLVTIVTYKTCHWPLVFVITLANTSASASARDGCLFFPGNWTREPLKKKPWMYCQYMVLQGGESEKEHPVHWHAEMMRTVSIWEVNCVCDIYYSSINALLI